MAAVNTPEGPNEDNTSQESVQLSDYIIMYSDQPLSESAHVHRGSLTSGVFGEQAIAVKFLPFNGQNVKEANILHEIGGHPNIVTLFHSDKFNMGPYPAMYIAMELCQTNNLYDRVMEDRKNHLPFDIEQNMTRVCQIVGAIDFIHDCEIVYRDLKPQNVLISIDGKRLKIADFGLSVKLSNESSENGSLRGMGTDGYRPPETYTSHTISKKMDIYSLAVVMYFIWSSGNHPFGDDPDDWNSNIKKNRNRDLSLLMIKNKESAKQLLEWMLQFEPNLRPNTKQILEHEVLDSTYSVQVPELPSATRVPAAAAHSFDRSHAVREQITLEDLKKQVTGPAADVDLGELMRQVHAMGGPLKDQLENLQRTIGSLDGVNLRKLLERAEGLSTGGLSSVEVPEHLKGFISSSEYMQAMQLAHVQENKGSLDLKSLLGGLGGQQQGSASSKTETAQEKTEVSEMMKRAMQRNLSTAQNKASTAKAAQNPSSIQATELAEAVGGDADDMKSLQAILDEEQCETLLKESKFVQAILKLKEVVANGRNELSTQLLIVECNLFLGRDGIAKKLISGMKQNILKSSPSIIHEIKALVDDHISKSHHLRAAILCYCLSSLHKRDSSPDEAITGIGSCISKADDVVEALEAIGGRSVIILFNIVFPFMKEMLEEMNSVEGAQADTKILMQATSLNMIGNSYLKVKDFREALNYRNKGLELTTQHFGSKAPSHRVFGSLLNNAATAQHYLGNYAEAEKLYLRAIEAEIEAQDYDNDVEKQGNIMNTMENLERTREKLKN